MNNQNVLKSTINKADVTVRRIDHILNLLENCKTEQAEKHYQTVLSAYTNRLNIV